MGAGGRAARYSSTGRPSADDSAHGRARPRYLHPLPGLVGQDVAAPTELCEPTLTSRVQVEAHLLDAFLPAAYQRPPGRWTAAKAERWHMFIARNLERRLGGLELGWWQIPLMVPAKVVTRGPGWAVQVIVSAILAISIGLAGANAPGLGLPGGLIGGLFGLVLGWAVTRMSTLGHWSSPMPSNEIRVIRTPGWRGLLSGVFAWLFSIVTVLEIASSLNFKDSYSIGAILGIIAVGGFWLVSSALNLGAVPIDLTIATNPVSTLRRDRRAAVRVGLAAGGISAIVAGLIVGAVEMSSEAGVIFGLAVGIPVGVRRSRRQAASPSFGLAALWLAWRHGLPLSLMAFLDDAHRRGVLRQAGATYQFRHVELQHRLAARYSDSRATRSKAHEPTSAQVG